MADNTNTEIPDRKNSNSFPDMKSNNYCNYPKYRDNVTNYVYNRKICFSHSLAGRMAKSANPEQSSLIWVYSVFPNVYILSNMSG